MNLCCNGYREWYKTNYIHLTRRLDKLYNRKCVKSKIGTKFYFLNSEHEELCWYDRGCHLTRVMNSCNVILSIKCAIPYVDSLYIITLRYFTKNHELISFMIVIQVFFIAFLWNYLFKAFPSSYTEIDSEYIFTKEFSTLVCKVITLDILYT